jgi:hypothetical protein
MSTDLDTEIRHVEAAGSRSQRAAEGSRYLFAAVAVCSIWLALAAASIWSPELVSGTDQTYVPIAAFTDWFYAVIATGLVLMAFSRRTPDLDRSSWGAFTLAISAIWLVVAIISIWTPELVSGTDRTHVPIAALVSPIAGVLATAFASVFVAGSAGGEMRKE